MTWALAGALFLLVCAAVAVIPPLANQQWSAKKAWEEYPRAFAFAAILVVSAIIVAWTDDG